MKQTRIDNENTNELYTVLPTVKKDVKHEPNIELLNMDCLLYMKQCEDKQFDLAIVDPPYGINADVNQNNLGGKKGFTKGAGTYKKYHDTNWDEQVPNQEYFKELARISDTPKSILYELFKKTKAAKPEEVENEHLRSTKDVTSPEDTII